MIDIYIYIRPPEVNIIKMNNVVGQCRVLHRLMDRARSRQRHPPVGSISDVRESAAPTLVVRLRFLICNNFVRDSDVWRHL